MADPDVDQLVYNVPKSEVETYMDPGITDDTFDDWLDLDGEENFPLQAEAAAFPEPGPSASQARKMDNKSNSNDIGLCRMCLGSFKRGTHKKKDCKKHHRYSNLLGHLSPEGKAKMTANFMDDALKANPKNAAVDLTTQFGKKISVTTVSAAGKNRNIHQHTKYITKAIITKCFSYK